MWSFTTTKGKEFYVKRTGNTKYAKGMKNLAEARKYSNPLPLFIPTHLMRYQKSGITKNLTSVA